MVSIDAYGNITTWDEDGAMTHRPSVQNLADLTDEELALILEADCMMPLTADVRVQVEKELDKRAQALANLLRIPLF